MWRVSSDICVTFEKKQKYVVIKHHSVHPPRQKAQHKYANMSRYHTKMSGDMISAVGDTLIRLQHDVFRSVAKLKKLSAQPGTKFLVGGGRGVYVCVCGGVPLLLPRNLSERISKFCGLLLFFYT